MNSQGLGPVAARVGALFAVWLLLSQKPEAFYLVLGLATAIAVVAAEPARAAGRPGPALGASACCICPGCSGRCC